MHVHADDIEAALPAALADPQAWHYTSMDGALGILQSGALHLSSVSMMNDDGELHYGLDLVRRRLEARSTATHIPRLDEIATTFIRERLESGVALEAPELYVGCASTHADSLGQIRGYGEYVLGIDTTIELDLIAQNDFYLDVPGVFISGWHPVIYDRQQADLHIDSVLDLIAENVCQHQRQSEEAVGQIDVPRLRYFLETRSAALLTACSLYLKHPAFAEEREVRVVANVNVSNALVALRAGRYGMTPYVAVGSKIAGLDQNQRRVSIFNRAQLGPGSANSESAFRGLELAIDHLRYPFKANQLVLPVR